MCRGCEKLSAVEQIKKGFLPFKGKNLMSVSAEDSGLSLLWEVVMPGTVFKYMSYATHNKMLEKCLPVKSLLSRALLAIGKTAVTILSLGIVW